MTQEDNLYPNQGDYFGISEPEEQKQARSAEESEIVNALPVIQRVIDHFTERIALRDSIKSINVDISENPELHQKTCAVNDMLAEALRDEKRRLEVLVKEYLSD